MIIGVVTVAAMVSGSRKTVNAWAVSGQPPPPCGDSNRERSGKREFQPAGAAMDETLDTHTGDATRHWLRPGRRSSFGTLARIVAMVHLWAYAGTPDRAAQCLLSADRPAAPCF